MGKSLEATKKLYNKHIEIYRKKEQSFFKQLTAQAKQPLQDLLELTSSDSQNRALENAIATLETMISYDDVINSGKSAYELQQELAKKILELDKELKILGEEESIRGLMALSKGEYGKVIDSAKGGEMLVTNQELNSWIKKIMVRIEKIKSGDQKKSFTGYLSNLKGAYLEAAVINELQKVLPKDVVVNTGNMGSGGRRQIAEDIMLLYSNGSKKALQALLNEKTKKRINIPVALYEDIQKSEGNAGISVKSGNAPIKFYDGNLNKFFTWDGDDIDLAAYHQNVLRRAITPMNDNAEGRSVNQYLVAYHLDLAVGKNNLFLSTRNKLLTTMSDKLEELRDNGQLYMTSYKIKGNSISGKVYEPKY
jgi:hypothetical protein